MDAPAGRFRPELRMTPRPTFSALDRSAIDALLGRQAVARLAYTHRDRVDIEPVHIVYADGWLYLRTQPGTKVATLHHHPWVALEVDEVRALFDWESAVVRGRLHVLEDGPHEEGRVRYRAAVTALRALVPEALTDTDPTPGRTIVCALYVDDVTGRRATMAGVVGESA
jgi:nitroimidazol reductase NimA-like FMN-containing flavoprotein (pyridoxamine 5'-phosphate oxidase superfamily)